jgi:hypothetical protein
VADVTVYEYVARRFNEDPFGTGTFTGPDCLDTLDGHASYAERMAGPVGSTLVTFRWEPVGAPAPGAPESWKDVWCRFAWKIMSGAPFANGRITHVHPDTGSLAINFGTAWGPYPDELTTDGYVLQSATIDPTIDSWYDPVGPDTHYRLQSSGTGTTPTVFRYTYARLFIEAGGRPLRQHPLDEGTGGSPRKWGQRSTARSTSGNQTGYQ